jgi:acyl-CoA synthetase (AMP-forming)/AMP-acid ligase II
MLGYYENDEATREVMTDDGWLKTGDIGYLDKKGCIHITGRKKSMIVLTNGKKAFPEEIEYLINKTAGIRILWLGVMNQVVMESTSVFVSRSKKKCCRKVSIMTMTALVVTSLTV